jgi:hypothetical protein
MRFTCVRLFTMAFTLAFAAVGTAAGQGAQPPSDQAKAPRQLFSIDHSLLTFGEVPFGSTSTVHAVRITSADKSLVNIHSTVAGEDFRLEPSECKVDAVTTCILSITFVPQHLYNSEATITISGTSSDGAFSTNQTVNLQGVSTGRCNAGEDFFSEQGFIRFLPALIVVAFFLIGIIVVRWNMVALPNKKLMLSQIAAVKAETESLRPPSGTAPSSPPPPALGQITSLLERAEKPFKEERKWWDQLADYMFWTRGEEMSAWACIHEAEEMLVDFLSQDRVTARMERAEPELRKINTPLANALADRIHGALNPPAGSPPAALSRCKALLGETLSIIYDHSDRDYTAFMSWQNKAVWLVGCSLLFILSLTAALQHGVLLLVGGVGGLLSRLSRSLQRADVPTDYGASWTTLFLSPVVGALMGWSGVLLVIIGVKLGVLGTAFNRVEWCNPWSAFTLGVAFLMGFSERAFDGILTQLEEKTSAQAKPASTTTTISATPGAGAGGASRTSLPTGGGQVTSGASQEPGALATNSPPPGSATATSQGGGSASPGPSAPAESHSQEDTVGRERG